MAKDNPYEGPGGIGDSLLATGVAAAPGAGAAIVTLAAPPAGVYRVIVTSFCGGTIALLEATNLQLKKGATVIGTVLPGMGGAVGTSWNPGLIEFPRVTLDGVSALTVNAIGAATVLSSYLAAISATRVA